MKKHLLSLTLSSILAIPVVSHAEFKGGFADIGVHYLRVEGVFYVGIGLLFLLYAIYRGLERAGMSVVLTVISLGLRVALAYAFAPHFGVTAIWLAIPIGWFIADAVGLIRLKAALPH